MEQVGIIILTGESGAGKTRLCERLVTVCRERGIDVSGILTPARFLNSDKVGIDVLDIRSGERRELAECEPGTSGPSTGQWHFHRDALDWGAQLLEQTAPSSLLILDELGPLELERGQGWANGIDLLRRTPSRAVVVIRPTLLEKFMVLVTRINVATLQVTRTNQDELLAPLTAFAEGAA